MTRLGRVRTLLANNYYQDEYQVWLAQNLTLSGAQSANRFDQGIVDGFVNGVGAVGQALGGRFRRLQSGVVSDYAALLTLGFVFLLLVFALAGGWWF